MPTFVPPTDQNGSIDPDDHLWRHYSLPRRGLNVWKYTDGTYQTTDTWPWAYQNPDVTDGGTAPAKVVAYAYYGGHTYTVSTAEAAALTAAGYGAYLS